MRPDSITFVGVLNICASVVALEDEGVQEIFHVLYILLRAVNVLAEPPFIIFTHQNQRLLGFLRAEYVDWMLTVIIGCLVLTAAMSGVLGGSCHYDRCS